MDRRSFVKLLGTVLGAAASGDRPFDVGSGNAHELWGAVAEPPSAFDYDVVIVGGGISGIYTAWRLMKNTESTKITTPTPAWDNPKKLKVAVFEGSDRIGGRLLSAHPRDFPEVKCELGGMRYLSTQTHVCSLMKTLGLNSHKMVRALPQNIAFLRGKLLHIRDLQNPKALPYNLEPKEDAWIKSKGAGDLVTSALLDLFPGADKLSPIALLGKLQGEHAPDGTPLFECGFGDLMAQIMSSEAFMLGRTTAGFDCLMENANAVDLAMESLDFATGVEHYMVDDGYDAVPWKLQDEFEKLGGGVFQGEWVSGFEVIQLGLKKGVRLRFRGNRQPVTARTIILAMPRRSIELLLPESPSLNNNKFRRLLGSVEPIPLFKMFMRYPRPWWKDVGVCAGVSISDTPVRQCWYWDSKDCTDNKTMIMSYNDMSSAAFWRGLRRFDSKPSMVPTFPKDCNSDFSNRCIEERLSQNWEKHTAPRTMLAEMHREVIALHGVMPKDAPTPIEGAFMDWSDDPYGGAVHFWNPGHKSWEVVKKMVHPIDDVPCYICGEAFSTNQTWVEGALETSEILLQEHFKLPAPS